MCPIGRVLSSTLTCSFEDDADSNDDGDGILVAGSVSDDEEGVPRRKHRRIRHVPIDIPDIRADAPAPKPAPPAPPSPLLPAPPMPPPAIQPSEASDFDAPAVASATDGANTDASQASAFRIQRKPRIWQFRFCVVLQ